jgi:hypothetical protein
MTSLSCGVDALLRAAQYLQFLEEQESGQPPQPQLYRPIVLENSNPPISTGKQAILSTLISYVLRAAAAAALSSSRSPCFCMER